MPSRRNSRRNRRRHSGGGDALMQGLDFLKNAPGKQMGGGCNTLHGAPVVGGDSMLLEGGLRETAGVARLDASVGEIRGMSDQAGGRRKSRKSRKSGRKSRNARKSRKSRKSGRKSRNARKSRKSRKSGRKSRKSGRKSRNARKSRKSRKSRSNRKSRMNGGGHEGAPVNAPAMLLSDYSKTGSGFTGNAFKDGAGSV